MEYPEEPTHERKTGMLNRQFYGDPKVERNEPREAAITLLRWKPVWSASRFSKGT